jgi:hypothetical protein
MRHGGRRISAAGFWGRGWQPRECQARILFLDMVNLGQRAAERPPRRIAEHNIGENRATRKRSAPESKARAPSLRNLDFLSRQHAKIAAAGANDREKAFSGGIASTL